MLVINVGPTQIPSGRKFTVKESTRLTKLQIRKHLQSPMVVRDKQGRETETREPLDEKERVELDELELARNDMDEPQIGHLRYPFEPHGKPGCVWDVPVGGYTLIARFPKRLRIASQAEVYALKIMPNYQTNHPDASEYQFGWKQGQEEEVEPVQAESMTHSTLVKDGVVKDHGPLGPAAKR